MEKVLMKGNEALAEAAIRAGCRFYSGYPITPQTEILEYMAWRMPEAGGTFVQTESELAGINMLYGGSAAGVRAMTSSSGPGFALLQEGISYLCAADLPAVLVNVMRIGNGLGDIAQGQGDYWALTRGGGNGDYRTIVLAPNSVQEGMDLVAEAFELSEKYLHPVIIGSDAAIGQMMEEVELPEMREHDINAYDWSVKGTRKGDKHKVVSNVCFYGHKDYENYLWNKYKEIEENEQRWESVAVEDAEIVTVAFGISSRICKEAVKLARAAGIKLGLIRPITLWPFPEKAFRELGPDVKALISVEMNILGQMVEDIRTATQFKYPVESYRTFFDVPDSERIVEMAKETLGGKEAAK